MATIFFLLFALQGSEVMRTEEGLQSLRIIFSWPETVQFTSATETRELFIRFDHAVKMPDGENLAHDFPKWIEGFSSSYDSILLRTAMDAKFNVTARGNEVLIEITSAGENPVSSSASERVAQMRLDLLEAQLLANTGREKAALDWLTTLAQRYPDEPQVLVNMADAEFRYGRWLRAKRLYDRSLLLDPEHNEAARARDFALRDHVSRIRLDVDRKRVRGAQSENILQLSGHHLFKESFRLGFLAARNRFEVPNGIAGQRSRGEVYVQYDAEGGRSIRSGFLTAASNWGATAEVRQPDSSGAFRLLVDYRRPFWEFVEGLIGGGTRDRVEMHRDQRVSSRMSARFSAAANRYGLDKLPNVASSLGFDGGWTTLVRRTYPLLGFEYSVDGEYRQSRKPVQRLPLVSREVHAASVFGDINIKESLRAEGSAGYAVDRLGGRGPFAAGRLTFRFFRNAEAQAWFDRRLNSVATGQVVNRYGGYLMWRFR